MMQGDSYFQSISILNNAGSPVTPADIRDVEITIGHIRKTYRQNQIQYHEGMWMFPISQNDTFDISPGEVPGQVRIAWANGVVEGKPLYGIRAVESISREVI